MEAIEVYNLTKKFPGVVALQSVTFKVPKGIVLALLGPNGSGKSTLLKILAGLQYPTGGYVKIFGSSPSPSIRKRIAYVPEVESLYRWMKVGEILKFASQFYEDWDQSVLSELLDFLELNPNQKIGTLSRGMKVRLKIALALSRKADLLLLDEPLSGIDPVSREKIIDALVKTYRFGEQTIVFSTHIVKEAEPFFDRVVFLDRGKIRLEEDAERLREREGMSIEQFFKKIYEGG
jgi:ABC-2 type transport system ATP-binding protein